MKLTNFFNDIINENKPIAGERLDVIVPKLGEMLYEILKENPSQIISMPEIKNFLEYYKYSSEFQDWVKNGRKPIVLLELVKKYLEKYINYNLTDNKTTKFVRDLKTRYPDLKIKITQLFNPEYIPRIERTKLKNIELINKKEEENKFNEFALDRASEIVNNYYSEYNSAIDNLKNILNGIKSQESPVSGEKYSKKLDKITNNVIKNYVKMKNVVDDYQNSIESSMENLKDILDDIESRRR